MDRGDFNLVNAIDSNIIKESQEKLIKYYEQMKEAYQNDDPKIVFDDGSITKV